jgi:hypothetical protein
MRVAVGMSWGLGEWYGAEVAKRRNVGEAFIISKEGRILFRRVQCCDWSSKSWFRGTWG